MRAYKLTSVIVAVSLLCIVTATFTFKEKQSYLGLYDGDTKEFITKYALAENLEFSIGFKHSVNKSMVVETYKLQDGVIYLLSCKYYGLGAGVATEISDGQKLEFLDDGSMLITNINRKIDRLSYIVGTVYDHMLYIDDEEINLREICGKNRTVLFSSVLK